VGTPHINAEMGAFAKVVLMPGDPLRAKWIAETYLVDAKLVNEVRGMLGYTGYTKNGKRVSVMASGMGQPSIGIYSHELYTGFGVESIIRIGTCGSYQSKINLFDVLACQTASTDSNWSSQFDLKGGTFSAPADFDLLVRAYEVLKARKMPLHVGNILSADIFYDVDPNSWKKWANLGVMGVEMESYSLYATAARLGKRALCLLSVTDHFLKAEKATSSQRQIGLGKMIEVALEVAESFAE